MGHDHNHGQGACAHGYAKEGSFLKARFAWGSAINLGFVGIEAFWAWRSGSMALWADAGHNLGDVLGLLLALTGAMLAARRPDARYSFGLRRASGLAALANSLILLAGTLWIAGEAIARLLNPVPVEMGVVPWIALGGVAVNGLSALLFLGDRHDLNVRAAFLHLAADAAVSASVALGAVLVMATGWVLFDPLLALAVCGFLLKETWPIFRQALDMNLDAVPTHLDAVDVRSWLEAQEGVEEIHDLHVWSLGTREVALTVHLVAPSQDLHHDAVREGLRTRFGIGHCTIQLEREACPQRCS
jgi:cobalt-zinc-cadmium efflux system protein